MRSGWGAAGPAFAERRRVAGRRGPALGRTCFQSSFSVERFGGRYVIRDSYVLPVNVEVLAKYFDDEVTPEALYAHGLIHKGKKVKILARGELEKALTVKAHAFSQAAKAKVEAAGGRAEIIT